jgi:hypothetical protein
MVDSPAPDSISRRRRISLGEFIAIAALVISALGLWNGWRSNQADKPSLQADSKASIPIAFRGRVEADGKSLVIGPVEPGHSLEALTLMAAGRPAISIGNDGRLTASAVERLVGAAGKDPKPGTLTARIEARYIEAGTLKRGGGRYRISYRWDDGGLFGRNRLRLTGLSIG